MPSCEVERNVNQLSVCNFHCKRQPQDNERRLPIRLHNKGVAILKAAVQVMEAVDSGLAFNPQYPIVAEQQFKVMAGLIGAADFRAPIKLCYREFGFSTFLVTVAAAPCVLANLP
jgi:hypothetical protein